MGKALEDGKKQEKLKIYTCEWRNYSFKFNSIANNFHVELNIIFKYKFLSSLSEKVAFPENSCISGGEKLNWLTQPIKLSIWSEFQMRFERKFFGAAQNWNLSSTRLQTDGRLVTSLWITLGAFCSRIPWKREVGGFFMESLLVSPGSTNWPRNQQTNPD